MSETKYRIVKRQPLPENVDLVDDQGAVVASGMHFEVTANSRIVFPINVGELPPLEAQSYVNKIRQQFTGMFPSGTVIYVPVRKGDDLTLYDLAPVE